MQSSAKRLLNGRVTWAMGVAVAMAIGISQLRADGGGQSFTTLAAGFTQELFGVSGNLSDPDFGILGGVAFAPNGDVWSSECLFDGTRLHRFHLDQFVDPEQNGTPLHPETIVEASETAGGCGLTNHPDGSLYSNSDFGIFRLHAETGGVLAGPLGRPGNGLGVAVDPQEGHHLVYVGADCHPSLNPDSTTCTVWDLNPATNEVGVFARLTRTELEFFDGIYFDPSGQYLFGAHRAGTIDPDTGAVTKHNSLRIIRRPVLLGDPDATPVDDTQIVQDVAMTSEPDGVAFHATDGFVVTLNESDDGPGVGGTMTRFDFGGNFEAAPSQSVFASGGFRGDLLQVGGDGCVYATQGVLFETSGTSGVRYNDGTEASENSIVKICGGFAPPPGVNTPGSISGFAYVDGNRNTVKDEGELVLAGVAITLTGSGTVVTDGNGSYTFATLQAGSYSVGAAAIANGKALFTSSPLGVELAAGEDHADVNFGYVPGSIAGFAYADTNGNGVKDSGEAGIGGVTISLGGAQTGTMVTLSDGSYVGSYVFSGLDAGNYSASAPGTAAGLTLSTPSSINVALAAGEDRANVNFGYVAPVVSVQCSKATVQGVLDPATGRYPGNHGPDQIVRFDLNQSVQGAINNVSDSNDDGYLIILVLKDGTGALGGARTESIEIGQYYSKPFALFGCSVTLNDANGSNGKPTARVTVSAGSAGAPGNIYVMDVHAAGSEAEGWLVEGNGRYLRNVEARGSAVGIRFVGNSNMMHNGAVENNLGVGLVVQGNSNTVTDTDAFSNSSHGVQVSGNTNQILKVDSGDKNKGNGGDGLHVEGAGNLLQENDAFANGGDGIELVASSGSPNIIKKTRSGDKGGLANAGNGILVSGPGNGTASPVELEQNTVKANGLVGIRITGTGHQLKNNLSGGSASGETNVGCEFNVAAGNVNATGNKANGTTVAGSNGSAFPTGCVGSN